jgi:hypothetical protein
MFNKRHIERHQLPCVLKVFNRFTDQESVSWAMPPKMA